MSSTFARFLPLPLLWTRNIRLTPYRFDSKKTEAKRLLEEYEAKRDFKKTNEPTGIEEENGHRFVVQEHHASMLHFDFRLEHNGVLKSWSVPKGPSLNPRDRRLAIMVEDHPLSYRRFQGKIPDGEYGAGEVRLWDKGIYECLGDKDMDQGMEQGQLALVLHGEKLKGGFQLVRFRGPSDQKANHWLLIKKKDEFADEHFVLKRVLDYGSRRELKSSRADRKEQHQKSKNND